MEEKDQGRVDYVFAEAGDGSLKLVGDFDGLYLSDPDPWEQSGRLDTDRYPYYAMARARLLSVLRASNWADCTIHGLEVGCGHGHVTNYLNQGMRRWEGMDISRVAVTQARRKYPALTFHHGDIAQSQGLTGFYDYVVLNQMWWYILEKLDAALENAQALLKVGGCLVVAHAFLKEQRYGKGIADGFDGAVRVLQEKLVGGQLAYANLFPDPEADTDDGIIVFRKH